MNKIFDQLNNVLKGRVIEGAPLAKYSKLQIGGLGEYVFEAANQNEIGKAKQISNMLGLDYKLIKMHDDVLIMDEGLKGLIIIDKTEPVSQIELNKSKIFFKDIVVDDVLKGELKAKGFNTDEGVKNDLLDLSYVLKEIEMTDKIIGGIKLIVNSEVELENIGNATANDVMILISYIKQRIRDRYNLQLIENIKILND